MQHKMTGRPTKFSVFLLLTVLLLVTLAPAARAHPEITDDPSHDDDLAHLAEGGAVYDPSSPLAEHDAAVNDIVSSGPSGKKIKNLELTGRGERLVPDATTDVWAHNGYAYLGTFNVPCGTGKGFGTPALVDDRGKPGIPVFNVQNKTKPTYVGNIPSVRGSRINDVKVATMNQGAILVHSNEPCAGGPGGFEIYNVNDPLHPVHLAHVQTDDINAFLRQNFGYTDFGVHNLYLFTRNGRDYAAAQVEGLFGSFQVFDITNPADTQLVSWFGAEYVLDPTTDWATTTDFGKILEGNAYLRSGFGASQNRFLHDHFITPDGQRAYLANWDAGLLLVDLGDLDGRAATLISQAIAPDSEDGEVNSHSVWPTADERIVIEGEEDFNPYGTVFSITSGSSAGEYPAAEGAFTKPIASLPDRTMSGPTIYVGLACNGDSIPSATNSGQLALIQRGGCRFDEKATNAINAGYAGMVVFNHAQGGDALVTMSGDPREIPGIFVGHSTGLKIAGVASASELVVGETGANVSVSVEANGWSGMRIWDYSDPANPVLAAAFNTVCSANPDDPSCDPRGTYSSHNVIVEGTKAYISWYSDGVVVLDISNPYSPREVARYHEAGPEFETRNGGIQDVWGIYKIAEEPWVYASDRNGGLYILKELGKGTIGK